LSFPKKHHYIPKFLLKRWAGDDGKLAEFQRYHGGVVKARRVHPSMTGYFENLYALRSSSSSESQQIERLFLQPVDTQASEALLLLERGAEKHSWPVDLVSAWTRFLISLLIRMPEDIDALRRKWRLIYSQPKPEEERLYQEHRSLEDPTTLRDFLVGQPESFFEKGTFESFINAHNSERIGQLINNMAWEVVDLSESGLELFLSDRPTIRTNVLAHEDGHIALPISPRLLFVAASKAETIRAIVSENPKKTVRECNSQVVGSAVRYTYSMTDKDLRYMQNRLGSSPQRRILDFPMKQSHD
jgi:Protein of unknown function (DUF4238)